MRIAKLPFINILFIIVIAGYAIYKTLHHPTRQLSRSIPHHYPTDKKFLLGYTTCENEVEGNNLPIQGTIPKWLQGTLLRTGPAKFELNKQVVQHWFDGFAMLHAFSFNNGSITYTNKFLQSNYYKKSHETGKLSLAGFASDPCQSIFSKFTSLFSSLSPQPDYDNANVNIAQLANHFVAMTETPMPIEFDPKTLETVGAIKFDDTINGHITTAHPHFDSATHEWFNYVLKFAKSSTYQIYKMPADSMQRTLIATIPAARPAYIHSFALTKNYIILAEIPFQVNPLDLLLKGKPFIQNFVWKPKKNSHFIVVDRNNGNIIGRYPSNAFFTFHHVNAYEKDDTIAIDLVAYNDPSVIKEFYLNSLYEDNKPKFPRAYLKRYTIDLKKSYVQEQQLCSENIEMPRINYERYNMKEYQYAYGISSNNNYDLGKQLIKINVADGSCAVWSEEHCYPGEPVFVAAPDAKKEDEGVILSVVLDVKQRNSFLLVLDAKTYTQLGRATTPHHIPFGVHGNFYQTI